MALAVETADRSTKCWLTSQWPRMLEVNAPTWLWHGLTTKKACDSVPHSWILEFWRLYKICPRLVTFMTQSMSHWKTTLPSNSKSITEVAIKCGVYQRDAPSPLQFCITLNPLSALLDKSTYRYRFKSGTTINHLIYMDDIKLYAKNEQNIVS